MLIESVAGGTITHVETSFDDSPNVVPSYVTFLDPLMTTIVPANERMSRAELKVVVERYFQALTDHKPLASDFDDRCDRYHSGQRAGKVTFAGTIAGDEMKLNVTGTQGDKYALICKRQK